MPRGFATKWRRTRRPQPSRNQAARRQGTGGGSAPPPDVRAGVRIAWGAAI